MRVLSLPRARMRFSAGRGFSLVEVVVGLAIGLIAILVTLQIFSAGQAQRRITTRGGDAQQNGMIAMYLLERDLRQAGYGIESLPAPCKSPPVVVTGAAGAHVITLMYSASAVGNVTGASCTTSNTIHRRYVRVVDGAQAGLQMQDLAVDGAVTALRRLTADIVALTAEPLPTAATPTHVRLAVAARNPVREKPDAATGQCVTTTAPLPTWPGGPTVTPPDDDSGVAESWKCYRYKIYHTVVPLRSLTW